MYERLDKPDGYVYISLIANFETKGFRQFCIIVLIVKIHKFQKTKGKNFCWVAKVNLGPLYLF